MEKISAEQKRIFEEESPFRSLIHLTGPAVIAQLIMMAYNLADTFFVGMTGDPYKVAAMTLAYVFLVLTTAMSNLFGIGGGTLISRLMGNGKLKEAANVSAFSLYATIVVSVIYSALCLIFCRPLLTWLGASDSTFGYAREYLVWTVVIGALPTMLAMTAAHLFRSEGYTREASIGLSMGCIINVVLDPVLMFIVLPPGMEVTGAAAAEMIANVISILYFYVQYRKMKEKMVISISFNRVHISREHKKSIFIVGIPAALGSALACVSNMIINKLAAGYGDITVAALGIVKKIDLVPLNVCNGIGQGMMPLAAYSYAIGNHKRMKQITQYALMLGISFSLVCVLACEVFPGTLVTIFIRESETVELGRVFLRVICLAVPLMVYNTLICNFFQAVGKGMQSMVLSICRQGLFNIPLMFALNRIFGVSGLIWAQFIADVITVIGSWILFRRFNSSFSEKCVYRKMPD